MSVSTSHGMTTLSSRPDIDAPHGSEMCDLLHLSLGLPASVTLCQLAWTGVAAPDAASERIPDVLLTATPRRQGHFRAGRYCARVALVRAGAAEHVVTMGEDRLPVWPDGWIGSISHADGMAVALAARASTTAGLGVDAEQWLTSARAADIAHLVATPQEIDLLAARAGTSIEAAVTVLFSAKEALYKALYPTVRQFFDFTAATLTDASAGHLTLTLTRHWHPRWPAGSEVGVAWAATSGHVVTVAHLPAPASASAYQASRR
ncbi:4'-phosphopantetheinyl transferase superfamily protein [Cupriavidus campinensis]|uniref:Enterobactin synthase component D n=2 Tax=Burkholderiaceae TaxID=119060 RepID=A0ABY3EK33_9BURK|nr:4'-phosphopantetheinyl transferase superfamily protein [Cupriavidus campinensis]